MEDNVFGQWDIDDLKKQVCNKMLEIDPTSEAYGELTDRFRILCECDKIYTEARLNEERRNALYYSNRQKSKE